MADDIIYTPPPTLKEFIKSYRPGELFYNWIVGPVGCVAGDTLVVTAGGPVPIADIVQPMQVLSWNAKTCQFQLSWCGGSFPKGRDYLYRVTTQEGVFDAAGHHLIFCADGTYRRVDHLRPGDVLKTCSHTQQPTNEVLSQSACDADGQRYSQTVVDSMGSYATLARLHGQRFLSEVGTDRGVAPAQDDALRCKGYSSLEADERKGDLLGRPHARTRQASLGDLLRMMRFEHLSESGAVAEGGPVGAELSLRASGLGRAAQQFLRSCATRLRAQLCAALGRWSPSTDLAGLWASGREASLSPSLNTANRTIISVERLQVKQPFWDMQVSDTNNYVTVDGGIHHNSGKTTSLFFKLVHMAKLQEPSKDGIRRTKAVIVRNTASQLRDTTIASWNYWFKDGQAGTWRATDSKFTLRFNDVECEVLFRPLDTPDDIERVLSLEVTFAILDEFVNIPLQIVDALSSRVGRYKMPDGMKVTNYGVWGSSNPSTEDNQWYPYLHENLPDNATYFHQPSGFSEDAENLENLPGGRAYYDNQAKGKSVAWVKQFIDAEWGFSAAGKPVIGTFNPELHVAKSPLLYDKNAPLVIGFDPGLAGSAFILGQEDLHGRLKVYGELVQEGYGAKRLVEERLRPYLRRRFPDARVIIAPDPAAALRSQRDEKTVVDELKRHYEVRYETNNRISQRLDSIERYTSRLTDAGPALLIDGKECPVLLRALKGGWRFRMDTKTDTMASPEPEKNQYSHPGDAFGYLARYYSRITERTERASRTPLPIAHQSQNVYHFR